MPPFFFVFLVSILGQQAFAEEPEAIVQGTRAALGEYPYQVSLNQGGGHFCGGSIIAPTKILTAAHCVTRVDYRNLKVVTGTIYSNSGQTHSVRSIQIHPDYIGKQEAAWVNDVAVITVSPRCIIGQFDRYFNMIFQKCQVYPLTAPIQYNKYQSPIPLATSEIPAGQRCVLTGWGRIDAKGPLSPDLLMMEQTTVSLQECQGIFGSRLTNKHLCALNYYGSGACRGDSGGPFVCDGVQYGVASFVSPCAKGIPDVYANVPNCLDFIRRNM